MTPEPLALTLSWVAGTSVASAWLAWWRVGGTGIRILLLAVVGAGLAGVGLTGGPGGTLAVGAAGMAVVVVTLRTPRLGVVGWAATGAAAFVPAAGYGALPALGDSILLGSITAGLCLGHWFLVDPHLPRGPMRALAGGGLVGLAVSGLATLVAPTTLPAIGEVVVVVAVVSGAITAVVLSASLWALAVPTYKGVQSATGLFYVSTMSVAAFVIVTSALRAAPL